MKTKDPMYNAHLDFRGKICKYSSYSHCLIMNSLSFLKSLYSFFLYVFLAAIGLLVVMGGHYFVTSVGVVSTMLYKMQNKPAACKVTF